MKKSKALAKLIKQRDENAALKDEIKILQDKCSSKQALIVELTDKLEECERLQKLNAQLQKQLESVTDEVKVIEAENEIHYLKSIYHFQAERLLDQFYNLEDEVNSLSEHLKSTKEKFVQLNKRIHATYMRTRGIVQNQIKEQTDEDQ